MEDGPVVLFDGVCNYCNRWINFAIRHDKKRILRFAPLQSAAGQRLLQQYNLPVKNDSVILIEKGKAYTRSTASLRIVRHLSSPAKWLMVLLAVPRFLRDPVYMFIARNRYKWFGKKEACMIPTPDVRDRFLT